MNKHIQMFLISFCLVLSQPLFLFDYFTLHLGVDGSLPLGSDAEVFTPCYGTQLKALLPLDKKDDFEAGAAFSFAVLPLATQHVDYNVLSLALDGSVHWNVLKTSLFSGGPFIGGGCMLLPWQIMAGITTRWYMAASALPCPTYTLFPAWKPE